MCAITGALSNCKSLVTPTVVSEMSNAMINRGPDSSGVWCDKLSGISLGHQRLAILDISSAGHQPMVSNSGRYVISFNGEIYNHLKLRSEIEVKNEGLVWGGTSDTETLLECFEQWGIEDTLKQIEGMFAIAVWDKKSKELRLIRDRFGEKPIYYGWQGDYKNRAFIFASELKALKKHPAFSNEIETAGVFSLCKYGFIPQPISIYKNIFKLAPGSILTVSLDSPDPIISIYWSSVQVASRNLDNKFNGSLNEAVLKLKQLLGESIQGAMLSDVPVGVYLSSGIDSTLIAAIMQAYSTKKLSAFTIGFEDKNYDESAQAARIAEHLGMNHHVLKLTPEIMMNAIHEMPHVYDEPFADSSQIPTYLVSKFAAKYVKVCLSGDGGDELFCGYTRHNHRLKNFLSHNVFSCKIKLILAKCLLQIPTSQLNYLVSFFCTKYQNIGEKIHKFAYVIQSNSEFEYYDRLLSFGSDNLPFLNDIFIEKFINDKEIQLLNNCEFIDKIMLLDTVFYLPNDILTKVDRASMSVSLETRAPFLNKNLFQFANSLPMHMKIKDGTSKLILRKVLEFFIPSSLMKGPKKGFSIPLAEWLRGPLKEWAGNLLSEHSISKSGILDPKVVQTVWQEHLSGKKNFQHLLWSILMFQAWYEEQ